MSGQNEILDESNIKGEKKNNLTSICNTKTRGHMLICENLHRVTTVPIN